MLHLLARNNTKQENVERNGSTGCMFLNRELPAQNVRVGTYDIYSVFYSKFEWLSSYIA